TYLAKRLAADGEEGVRIGKVRDVVGRAHDIGHLEAAFPEGGRDGLKAVACLACDIRRDDHGGVVGAGGARDEVKIAVEDGAALAGGLLEGGGGGDQAAGHENLCCQGFGAGFKGFWPRRATPRSQGTRRVTSEEGAGAELQRRAKMSRTIMTASRSISTVV